MSTPIDQLLISVRLEQGSNASRLLNLLNKVTDVNGDVIIEADINEKIEEYFDDIGEKINSINRIHSRWKSKVESKLERVKEELNKFRKDLSGLNLDVDFSQIEDMLIDINHSISSGNTTLNRMHWEINAVKGEISSMSFEIQEILLENNKELMGSLLNAEMILNDLKESRMECCEEIISDLSEIRNLFNVVERNILTGNYEKSRDIINTIKSELDERIGENELWSIDNSIMMLENKLDDFMTTTRGFKQIVSKSINEKLKEFKSGLDNNLREVLSEELPEFEKESNDDIIDAVREEFNDLYETIGAVIESSIPKMTEKETEKEKKLTLETVRENLFFREPSSGAGFKETIINALNVLAEIIQKEGGKDPEKIWKIFQQTQSRRQLLEEPTSFTRSVISSSIFKKQKGIKLDPSEFEDVIKEVISDTVEKISELELSKDPIEEIMVNVEEIKSIEFEKISDKIDNSTKQIINEIKKIPTFGAKTPGLLKKEVAEKAKMQLDSDYKKEEEKL